MPQVILYNPRSSDRRTPVLPMSLLALGALLEGRHDYRIVDGNLEADPLATLHALLGNDDPPLLAVTVMPGPQLSEAVPLCRELKSRHPRLTVIWGGYFPSQHWDLCLRSGYIDWVVRGHGEHAFVSLLDALRAGSPRASDLPPGIAGRIDGSIVDGGVAPVPSPAELPEWNLDRVPVERYLRPTFLGRRTIGYHSSYGCPFRCNFCAVVNLVDGRWLAQPAKRVAAAFESYKRRFGADAVELNDNNFFTQEPRVVELAERIAPLSMAWWGEGRIDTLLGYREQTWKAMAKGGLRMVFMGAEAASADVLARMDKGGTLTPEMTVELVARMKEHHVVPELSFVVGSPPEPEADLERTVAFVRRVKEVNAATEIIFYLYTPVPFEADLFDRAAERGFRFPDSLEGWVSPEWLEVTARRGRHLPWMSRGLAPRLRDFERVLHAYYPTATRAIPPWQRRLLRAASAWRYRLGTYRNSLELALLQRAFRYRRPEAAGF